jgi:Fe-S-cluster containining protein
MPETEAIFKCTRCGYCCHGETTVSLDEQDQQRMCDALGMSREEVQEKYWRVTDHVVQMKIVEGHCIFYSDGCTVHNGRPWRCGEWPLHPSILNDENNFHVIAESCPGIKKELGYTKFCEILSAILIMKKRIKC